MTKLTLDDKEYEIDNMNDDQKEIINILNVGSNASALLNHISQCVEENAENKTNGHIIRNLCLFPRCPGNGNPRQVVEHLYYIVVHGNLISV